MRTGMATIDLSTYSFDAMVFDVDGTLVLSAPTHFKAFSLALRDQYTSMDEEWYQQRQGLSRFELLTALNQKNGGKIDVARAVSDSESYFLACIQEVTEIDAVASIVRREASNYPMAVASSGQRSSVEKALDEVGLLSFFTIILTADDITACKPNPEIYITAAARLGLSPSRCLVFEDSDEGITAASVAGSTVIDVRAYTVG